MAEKSGLTLSELVKQAAGELRKVKAEEPPPDEAVMQFIECQIDLNVKVSVEGRAGIKFWILDVGGKAARDKGHMIRLKFSAIPGRGIQALQERPGPAKKPKRQTKDRSKDQEKDQDA